MSEELRTEAEKKLVFAKKINDSELTGLVNISKNPPELYCFCTEKVANEILDFHAQQSKDRDAFTIAFTDWVVYEACCSSATKGKSITELLEIYKSNNLKK